MIILTWYYFLLGLSFLQYLLIVAFVPVLCYPIVRPGSFHGDQALSSKGSADASSVALDALISCLWAALPFRASTVFPARRAGPSHGGAWCATGARPPRPHPRPRCPGPAAPAACRGGACGRRARTARAPPLRPSTQPLRGLRVHRAVLLGSRGRQGAWGIGGWWRVAGPRRRRSPPRAFVTWWRFSWGRNNLILFVLMVGISLIEAELYYELYLNLSYFDRKRNKIAITKIKITKRAMRT